MIILCNEIVSIFPLITSVFFDATNERIKIPSSRWSTFLSMFLSRPQQLCKFIQSACYVACIQVILHYPNNEETLPIRNRRFHLRILRFAGRCYDLDRETMIPGLISSIQRIFHRIYDESIKIHLDRLEKDMKFDIIKVIQKFQHIYLEFSFNFHFK